jgi:hypothetical protein
LDLIGLMPKELSFLLAMIRPFYNSPYYKYYLSKFRHKKMRPKPHFKFVL